MDARDEIEALLPAYAAGRLSADETERVERALREDPTLEDELRFVEALAEGVRRSAATPTPGDIGLQRLRRSLSTEAKPQRQAFAWWPQVAVAALVVVALQGALLWQVTTPFEEPYEPLAGDAPGLIQVRFAPDAELGVIEGMLREEGLEIVSGPGAAGVYRLRPTDDAADRDPAALVERLRARSALVTFAARQ